MVKISMLKLSKMLDLFHNCIELLCIPRLINSLTSFCINYEAAIRIAIVGVCQAAITDTLRHPDSHLFGTVCNTHFYRFALLQLVGEREHV